MTALWQAGMVVAVVTGFTYSLFLNCTDNKGELSLAVNFTGWCGWSWHKSGRRLFFLFLKPLRCEKCHHLMSLSTDILAFLMRLEKENARKHGQSTYSLWYSVFDPLSLWSCLIISTENATLESSFSVFPTVFSDHLWWPWICVGGCCHLLWMCLGSRMRNYRIDAAPQQWHWGEFPLGAWMKYLSFYPLPSPKAATRSVEWSPERFQTAIQSVSIDFRAKDACKWAITEKRKQTTLSKLS